MPSVSFGIKLFYNLSLWGAVILSILFSQWSSREEVAINLITNITTYEPTIWRFMTALTALGTIVLLGSFLLRKALVDLMLGALNEMVTLLMTMGSLCFGAGIIFAGMTRNFSSPWAWGPLIPSLALYALAFSADLTQRGFARDLRWP